MMPDDVCSLCCLTFLLEGVVDKLFHRIPSYSVVAMKRPAVCPQIALNSMLLHSMRRLSRRETCLKFGGHPTQRTKQHMLQASKSPNEPEVALVNRTVLAQYLRSTELTRRPRVTPITPDRPFLSSPYFGCCLQRTKKQVTNKRVGQAFRVQCCLAAQTRISQAQGVWRASRQPCQGPLL